MLGCLLFQIEIKTLYPMYVHMMYIRLIFFFADMRLDFLLTYSNFEENQP